MSKVDRHDFKPADDNTRRCKDCGEPEAAAVHQDGGVVRVNGR